MPPVIKSIFKFASALVLAGIVLGGAVLMYVEWEDSKRRNKELVLNLPVNHTASAEALGLNFSLRVKYSDYYMSYQFVSDVYPSFMRDSKLAQANKERSITFRALDFSGFEIATIPVKMNQFASVVSGAGEESAISHEGKIRLSQDEYEKIYKFSLQWNVERALPKQDRVKNEDVETAVDHCAPGISKAERLRRLATKGSVRETGDNDYTAGVHNVTFFGDGTLLYCR